MATWIGEVTEQNIRITSGDTKSFTVVLTDDAGSAVNFSAGDTVYFTVKKRSNQTTNTFQKEVTTFTDNNAVINIEPSDTSSLDVGDYKYDIQWTKLDGDVYTIIKGTFKIEEGITDD